MARRKRLPGQIEELPSGSLRVKVFAGQDPLTGRRRFLTETMPADQPEPKKAARKALNRLLNEVDERRFPPTSATMNQLLDRWLEVVELAETTRRGYVGKIEKHIRPTIGKLQVGEVD